MLTASTMLPVLPKVYILVRCLLFFFFWQDLLEFTFHSFKFIHSFLNLVMSYTIILNSHYSQNVLLVSFFYPQNFSLHCSLRSTFHVIWSVLDSFSVFHREHFTKSIWFGEMEIEPTQCDMYRGHLKITEGIWSDSTQWGKLFKRVQPVVTADGPIRGWWKAAGRWAWAVSL